MAFLRRAKACDASGPILDLLWLRFLLVEIKPEKWFTLPLGSGRFVARYFLIFLIFLAGLIPAFVVMGLIGELAPPASNYAAFALLGMSAVAMLCICLRLLLIFPAIAVQETRITMRRSFVLTRKIWPALSLAVTSLTVGTVMAMAAILVPTEIVMNLLSPGPFEAALLLVEEAILSWITFASGPAVWGSVALAYKAVADFDAPNEKGGIAAAPEL